MGYVFTPEEYENSKIPSTDSYLKAVNMLKEGLYSLCKSDVIYGANIYGSVMFNDFGIGSDLDVLIITNSDADSSLRELYEDIKDSTHVPIEIVSFPRYLAERGAHDLNYFYTLFIKTFCKDGIIGSDPTSAIKPNSTWYNHQKEVMDRFISQLSKMSKQRLMNTGFSAANCLFIEKSLRQPIFAAIDMIRLKYGNYPSSDGRPLSKKECCELYAREFPFMESGGLFDILAARQKYRTFLEKNESVEEYRSLLKELDDIYPVAKRVIENNLKFLLAQRPA